MKLLTSVFAILLFVNSNIALSNSIYFETFSQEDSTYSTGGWVLHNTGYIGVRFNVNEAVTISQMFGNIYGFGTFFAGITALNSSTAYPTPTPGFEQNSLLAYSEITIDDSGFTSSDHIFETNTNLSPGDYFLFFGGVDQNSGGYMPWASDLTKSNIGLKNYLEYSLQPLNPNVNGWFEFEYSGIRAGLVAVPLPASLLLFCSGIMTLLLTITKKSNKALHLTVQHAAPLRSALCCPSAELKRYVFKG